MGEPKPYKGTVFKQLKKGEYLSDELRMHATNSLDVIESKAIKYGWNPSGSPGEWSQWWNNLTREKYKTKFAYMLMILEAERKTQV